MGRTIAQVSESTLILQTYLEGKKDGAQLSYSQIGNETGVRMNDAGKSYLRTALKRAKKEYSTIRKYGIKLADKDTAMGIVTHKLEKIDRSIKRGEKTHKNIQSQFFDSLSQNEQREILYLGAVFGAIRVAANNGKIVYLKQPKNIGSSVNIPIPKI